MTSRAIKRNIILFKRGKIKTLIAFIFASFIAAVFISKIEPPRPEIVELSEFTDYYEGNEEDMGGVEVLENAYYTFEKKYNFSGDLKKLGEEVLLADGKTEDGKDETDNLAESSEKKETPQKIEYVIKKGDTFESIAKANGMTVEMLKANNPNLSKKAMKEGDKLVVLSANGIMYKVVKGDSLYKIALKFKMDVDDIIAYNKDINAKNLKPGQDLFIKEPSLKALASLNKKKDDVKDMRLPKGKKEPVLTKNARLPKGGDIAIKRTGGPDNKVSGSGGGSFRFPVAYRGISSPYGNRFHPVLKRYVLHTGVDLIAKYVPLKASRGGRVSFAGYMGGYGKVIIIKHPDGYETRYAHLSSINTQIGANIKSGQLIGKTGMSGRVTGPHLHFEIRKNGQTKNPMRFLGRK